MKTIQATNSIKGGPRLHVGGMKASAEKPLQCKTLSIEKQCAIKGGPRMRVGPGM